MATGPGALPKKQKGAKIVTGSTSTVKLGKDHRQHITKHAQRGQK